MLPFVGNICGYPPAVRPIADIRRSNFALLAEQAGGRPAIAAKLGKDPNQVDQWLMDPARKAARNIGSRSARMIEQAFTRPAGWLDHEHAESDGSANLERAPQSQPVKLDPATMLSALKYLERRARECNRSFDPFADADLLCWAYEIEAAGVAAPSNVIDFGQEVLKRFSRGNSGDAKGRTG